jgi:hypothetical protein
VSDLGPVKIVGQRRAPGTPAERLREAAVLIQAAEKLNPHPRPRGFVFKARTYAEYERWRREQENPRLW